MADLTQEEWRSRLDKDDNAVIIDVRTEEEIEAGFIPGAIHLDFYKPQEFLEELDKLDKSKHYYLYCRSGNRSALATDALLQLGYKNVYSLTGGFNSWKENFPDSVEINIRPVDPSEIGPVTTEESGGSC